MSNCNLTTCRYNKDGKCTNAEKRAECLEVAKAVLCVKEAKRANVTDKNKYLVYQIGTPEMGTEGSSSRSFFCVAEGDTKEEVIENWVENVEKLYGIRLNPKYNERDGRYWDYNPIYMNQLIKTQSDAQVEPLAIIERYRKHEPTFEHIEKIYEAE